MTDSKKLEKQMFSHLSLYHLLSAWQIK